MAPIVSALVAGYLFSGSDAIEWESTGERESTGDLLRADDDPIPPDPGVPPPDETSIWREPGAGVDPRKEKESIR